MKKITCAKRLGLSLLVGAAVWAPGEAETLETVAEPTGNALGSVLSKKEPTPTSETNTTKTKKKRRSFFDKKSTRPQTKDASTQTEPEPAAAGDLLNQPPAPGSQPANGLLTSRSEEGSATQSVRLPPAQREKALDAPKPVAAPAPRIIHSSAPELDGDQNQTQQQEETYELPAGPREDAPTPPDMPQEFISLARTKQAFDALYAMRNTNKTTLALRRTYSEFLTNWLHTAELMLARVFQIDVNKSYPPRDKNAKTTFGEHLYQLARNIVYPRESGDGLGGTLVTHDWDLHRATIEAINAGAADLAVLLFLLGEPLDSATTQQLNDELATEYTAIKKLEKAVATQKRKWKAIIDNQNDKNTFLKNVTSANYRKKKDAIQADMTAAEEMLAKAQATYNEHLRINDAYVALYESGWFDPEWQKYYTHTMEALPPHGQHAEGAPPVRAYPPRRPIADRVSDGKQDRPFEETNGRRFVSRVSDRPQDEPRKETNGRRLVSRVNENNQTETAPPTKKHWWNRNKTANSDAGTGKDDRKTQNGDTFDMQRNGSWDQPGTRDNDPQETNMRRPRSGSRTRDDSGESNGSWDQPGTRDNDLQETNMRRPRSGSRTRDDSGESNGSWDQPGARDNDPQETNMRRPRSGSRTRDDSGESNGSWDQPGTRDNDPQDTNMRRPRSGSRRAEEEKSPEQASGTRGGRSRRTSPAQLSSEQERPTAQRGTRGGRTGRTSDIVISGEQVQQNGDELTIRSPASVRIILH